MKFRVEEVTHGERTVWRIVGSDNECVGGTYRLQPEAERECQKLNEMHATLEQALKVNEIMEPLSKSYGKVCALIGQTARLSFGQENKNVLLPPHVTPKLGDTLLLIGGAVTIEKPKEVER